MICSIFLLTACSSSPEVREVYIPTLIPCKIEVPAKPDFAMNNLGIGADIFTQVRTLLAERKQRQGYELELEVAIKACNE